MVFKYGSTTWFYAVTGVKAVTIRNGVPSPGGKAFVLISTYASLMRSSDSIFAEYGPRPDIRFADGPAISWGKLPGFEDGSCPPNTGRTSPRYGFIAGDGGETYVTCIVVPIERLNAGVLVVNRAFLAMR